MTWEVDVESLACPVSVIIPETQDTIQRFFQQERAHKATGGVLYGPDSSLWSARWFDTVNLIQTEIERADNAFERAKAAYLAAQRS